jgi:hypothetical protein
MRVQSKRRFAISSAWLVRVLADSKILHHCRECGARMFVEAASGCCPVCFTRARELDQIAEGEAHAAIDDWA